MVAGSVVEVVNSPVAVERMWKSSLDGQNLMPKVKGDLISKIEVIQGDGGVGTVKKYHMVHAVHGFQTMTDKVEVLDHHKHVFKYSVVEGGLLGIELKAQTTEFKFEAAGGGSVVTVTVEYETLGADDLDAEDKGKILGGIVGMMKAVEAHLIANPAVYA